MNKEEYRKKFAKFIGDDTKYRKFVAQLNSRNKRLAFWQEKEIERFSDTYSLEILDYDDLVEIFSICEVHGDELKVGSVNVFEGNIDYSPVYSKSLAEKFPNSYLDEINGPEELFGKSVEIKYCSSCRNAREEWLNRNT